MTHSFSSTLAKMTEVQVQLHHKPTWLLSNKRTSSLFHGSETGKTACPGRSKYGEPVISLADLSTGEAVAQPAGKVNRNKLCFLFWV